MEVGRKSAVSTERKRRTERWKEAEGREMAALFGGEWKQSWVQYPPPLHAFHSDRSLRRGQRIGIKLKKIKEKSFFRVVPNLTRFGRFFPSRLLRLKTDRTVQQRDGGWLVRNGTGDVDAWWLPRSGTSQEIVGYWLLGGDASGLLRRRFKYNELPL